MRSPDLFRLALLMSLALSAPTLGQNHPDPVDAPAAHAPEASAGPQASHEPAAHDAGGHAGAPANIFAGGLGNALWTTVIFGIVVYILGSRAWPQMMGLIAERERSIRESLESARRNRDEAEQLLNDYKRQINKAREEATAIVDEGRRDGEIVREQIQHDARDEANRIVARAKQEIQLATDAAVRHLYDESASLATHMAGNLLRHQLQLSPEDHRALVQRSLEEMRTARQAKLN